MLQQTTRMKCKLQVLLSGTNTIIHGRYAQNNGSQISSLRELAVSELINEQLKMETFQRLYRALHFLLSNVMEERIYMVCGQKDETTENRSINLYEVVNQVDQQTVTFLTQDLLEELAVP